MSEKKLRKRNRKINNTLLVILMIVFVLIIIAFAMNIIRIGKAETGEGTTIEETAEPADYGNEYANDYYSIGYNPTEVNKEYFRELDKAVEADSQVKADIASALVKCFVTEYYTWTNKDGNYDIGGMQYIYTDRRADFERYTRYGFYADLDLYLTQYNRTDLIQVKWVSVSGAEQTEPYILMDGEPALECYRVEASWEYEDNSAINTDSIQKYAVFYVSDHDGRMEIVSIE